MSGLQRQGSGGICRTAVASVLVAAPVLGVLLAASAAFGIEQPEPPAPVNAGVQSIKVIDGGQYLTAVSCPAANWCAVSDQNRNIIMDLNGTWQKPDQVFPASSEGVDGVSCPTTTFCMAVSYIGGWAEYSGGKWSAPHTSMVSSGGGWGVSCASPSFCMAEDGAGDIDEWSSGKWHLAYNAFSDPNDGIGQTSSPVSCLLGAKSPCVYVNNGDYAQNWNGTSWSKMTRTGKADAAGLVSCSKEPKTVVIVDERRYPGLSESMCQVVDYNGDAYWWNSGSKWTSLGRPDSVTDDPMFEGLSCVYYLCAGVDIDGNVLYEAISAGGRGQWSKPYTMFAEGQPQAISCASYSFCMSVTANGEAIVLDPQLPSKGYWLASRDGTVTGFGGAQALGGARGVSASDPVVGIAAMPTGNGYFTVTRNGTVTPRGDALYHGDLPALHVTVSDIVGIAPTFDGKGYWLVAADGGEFAFGDAKYHGSLPGLHIHVNDVVGMVATPSGSGYLMVGADGGVFAFGAAYHGSLPGLGIHVDDIVGILPTGGEAGYVLVGKDGGAFVFGHGSGYYGSLPGEKIQVHDVVGIGLTPDQHGYWMCESDGVVHAFGDASVYASNAYVPTPVAAIAGT
jgi:hypothetical protein